MVIVVMVIYYDKEAKMAKKRSQGEGSIYKRKDGLWVAQVTIQGKHISKYFKTQSEARQWLQTTRSQIQDGLTFMGAKTTLKEFLEEWLKGYAQAVRSKTYHQYVQIVHQHIDPAIGAIKLKDLRPDQIQTFYNTKITGGTSPRTVLLIHAVLHRALNHALKWGLLGRNPAQAVTRPKFKRKEMKTLNDSQVRVLLSASKGTRNEALFWLAVSTGMRQGEILGLKWSDLDWRMKRLQIQRQLQRLTGEGLVFTEPKTSAGKRAIVLSATMIEKLREYLALQQQERQLAGEKWEENDLIFPNWNGKPQHQRYVYQDFKDTLKKTGLPDIRFHDLRHTAATLMLQQGIHPKVVQERLGHSDISMTLNTYSHVLPSMQEEAAEKMDELLKPIEVSEELKKLAEPKQEYVILSQGNNKGIGQIG
jgi:integrase